MANKTILIVGETGSGKSTFINSVFGKDVELEKPASVRAEFCSCTRDVEESFYERKDGLIISLRVLALADEPSPPKEDLNGCMEQNWDALEDSQSVTTYAESEQTETNKDLEPPKQDLNGCLEQSCDTPEDLQSVTNYAESEQTDSEMNGDPKRRCINEREWPFPEFCDQWKVSLLVTQHKSFAESQAQVQKGVHSEILEDRERLGSQVVELKKALELNEKQYDKPATVKMETNSVDDVSRPRAQLGETKSERDRVEASKLETERELERTKEMFKEAKEELARLMKQVQAQANESKVLEAQAQESESTRPRNEVQDKTQRLGVFAFRMASQMASRMVFRMVFRMAFRMAPRMASQMASRMAFRMVSLMASWMASQMASRTAPWIASREYQLASGKRQVERIEDWVHVQRATPWTRMQGRGSRLRISRRLKFKAWFPSASL